MNQKPLSFLEQLQQKTVQTGGKGSVRRKVINKSNHNSVIPNKLNTAEEIKLDIILKNINNKLHSFDPDTYQLANAYLIEEASVFFSGTSRSDIKKKNELDKIRKQGDEFLQQYFVKQNSDTKTTLVYNYAKLLEIFNHDGILNIIEFFEDTYKFICKAKFTEESDSQDEEEMTIKECFEILGLDNTDTPNSISLSKAFRKKAAACHPDKNVEEKEKYEEIFKKLNKAKKIVKEYYNLQ